MVVLEPRAKARRFDGDDLQVVRESVDKGLALAAEGFGNLQWRILES